MPPEKYRITVIISWSCHIRLSQTGELNRNLFSHRRLEVWNQGVGKVGYFWRLWGRIYPSFPVSFLVFRVANNLVGEGNGTPLQYSCLENPMDGVAQSWTRLSDFTCTFHLHALEKEMATHSSVLAWRIPGTGKPGRLRLWGSHRVGHNWSDLAAWWWIFWKRI